MNGELSPLSLYSHFPCFSLLSFIPGVCACIWLAELSHRSLRSFPAKKRVKEPVLQ